MPVTTGTILVDANNHFYEVLAFEPGPERSRSDLGFVTIQRLATSVSRAHGIVPHPGQYTSRTSIHSLRQGGRGLFIRLPNDQQAHVWENNSSRRPC